MHRPDQSELFTPLRPSTLVSNFIAAHPERNLQEELGFLVRSFPQIDGDQVQWLVDGGTAVSLLTGNKARPIGDIDIVTRREELARDFANSGRFDAKYVASWLKVRDISPNERIVENIFNSYTEVLLNSRELLVMQPRLLAASKLLQFYGQPPRDKDLADVDLLLKSAHDHRI